MVMTRNIYVVDASNHMEQSMRYADGDFTLDNSTIYGNFKSYRRR